MLPSQVERVRIFTCDWPADLLPQSDLVQKTVEEYALLLLDGIQRRPLATNDRARREERPILFVASCLGGIILAKALVDAGEEHLSQKSHTRHCLPCYAVPRDFVPRCGSLGGTGSEGLGFNPRQRSEQATLQRERPNFRS